MVLYLCLIYILTRDPLSVSAQSDPALILPQGEVIGTFETYQKNNNPVTYSVFRGIPYAKPPVGELRFKNPEKLESGTSTFQAKNFGSKCPQWDSQGKLKVGDEDCLFINVYTPLAEVGGSVSATSPVMVFIHGGNFQRGSSDPYMQQNFIENEFVLVTFNYRLGVLGFLSTGDEVCPGNLGLKDQVLALEWVRDNIRHFGGDSSSVTLFGQGAGAVSVFLHILSPNSQGLFHRAITESGSPLCDWTIEEDPYSYAAEIARRLRCSTKSTREMMNCIQGKNYQEILEAQKDNKTFGEYPLRAVPVVEKNGFLPELPAKLLNSSNIKLVPLISGLNKDDGTVLYSMINSYQDSLRRNSSFLLNELIPMFLLTATDIRGNIESVSQAVYFQYFNGIDPLNQTQVLQPFVNMTTDAMFVSCNYRTVQSYSARGAQVYMYTFEHKGQYSMLELDKGINYNYNGVSHGDELLYIFDIQNAELTSTLDTRKKKQMNFLWRTFAKTGAPPTTISSEYPKWEPYNSELQYYYKIGESITQDTAYRRREIDFWLNHLPALANITRVSNTADEHKIGGFAWAMLAIALILLFACIAITILLLRKSKSKYATTNTEDK